MSAVARGELSTRQAAELCGLSRSTFSDRLSHFPDYVKAKAAGLLPEAPAMVPVNVEALRSNPAVLAVVEQGLSLVQAVEAHPDSATNKATLARWVKQAYPDFKSTNKGAGKRRTVEEMVSPDIDKAARVVIDMAKALNIDPERFAKWTLKRVETSSRA